jgi:hypothetical protein
MTHSQRLVVALVLALLTSCRGARDDSTHEGVPRELQNEDISTVTIHPRTGLPVWYRTLTAAPLVGFPPFSVHLTIGELLTTEPYSNSTSNNSSGNSTGFVPPSRFFPRAVPSPNGRKSIVFLPGYRVGVDPNVTCDVLYDESVLYDTWDGRYVAKVDQKLAVIGCVGTVPVTTVHVFDVKTVEFVGLLPLLITWATGVGIGSGALIVLSRLFRRGLVPVYNLLAQLLFLIRVLVAPMYILLLIDIYRGNGTWLGDMFLSLYLAGAGIIITISLWWTRAVNIASPDALTGPAVRSWAYTFQWPLRIMACGAFFGSHILAVAWSGMLGLRMFQAPAGVWRRVPLLDLALLTVLFMDAPAVASAVYTILRNEADVAVPNCAWPVAAAGGGAILVNMLMALAAPLAADEAALVTRLTGLYAMRREIQWLKRKEKERDQAEKEAARDKLQLVANGGVVDAEERAAEGITTVVRKVGVSAPSRGLAVPIQNAVPIASIQLDTTLPSARIPSARPNPSSARAQPLSSRADRAKKNVPVILEEALALGGLDGVDVEKARGQGLMLDDSGGYSGGLKPIPKVANVRKDAVMFMRALGHQSLTVPGVPRPTGPVTRGALGGGYLDPQTGAPVYREEGVWGGNSLMEVVGRPVTPPEERRRRAKKEAEKEARKKRKEERRRSSRVSALSSLSARMTDQVLTARSGESSARSGNVSGRTGAESSRTDFTAGGLMSIRSGKPSARPPSEDSRSGRLSSIPSEDEASSSRTGDATSGRDSSVGPPPPSSSSLPSALRSGSSSRVVPWEGFTEEEDPDKRSNADIAKELRDRRSHSVAASASAQGHGVAGGGHGRMLPVPSLRFTTSKRFLMGTSGTLGISPEKTQPAHHTSIQPPGTGLKFRVAPGASHLTASETHVAELKAHLKAAGPHK